MAEYLPPTDTVLLEPGYTPPASGQIVLLGDDGSPSSNRARVLAPGPLGAGQAASWQVQAVRVVSEGLLGQASQSLSPPATLETLSAGPLGSASILVSFAVPAVAASVHTASPLGSGRSYLSFPISSYAVEVLSPGPLGPGSPELRAALVSVPARISAAGPLGKGAQTLLPESTGEPPAPPPSVSAEVGMVAVPPQVIPETEVVWSSADDELLPLWDPAICYRIGDQVRTADGRQWQSRRSKSEAQYGRCKTLYNVNRKPDTAKIPLNNCTYEGSDTYWWQEVTLPRNYMRMFDASLETETVANGALEVHILPSQAFDSICLFGLTASSVTVEIGNDYFRTFDLRYENPLYRSVLYKDVAVDIGVPEYVPGVSGVVKLLFVGVGENLLYAEGTVKVGALVLGMKNPLGFACYETSVAITDYSSKDRDVWGLPKLKIDTYSDRVEYLFEADAKKLYEVRDAVASYRGIPVAYVGVDFREETCVLGVYQDATMPLDNCGVSTCTLTILGLPAHLDHPYENDCIVETEGTYGGKTIFITDQLESTCVDAEPVDGLGECQELTIYSCCGNDSTPAVAKAYDRYGNDVRVSINGDIFYNGVMDPLAPWRDVLPTAVAWWDGVWVIVGYEGLILTSNDGIIWTRRYSPRNLDYYSVVAGPSDIRETRPSQAMIVIFSGYGREFSFDQGETWLLQSELSAEQSNVFDGVSGIYSGSSDTVKLSWSTSVSKYFYDSDFYICCSGNTVNYLAYYTDVWRTLSPFFTFQERILGVAVSDGPNRKLVFASNARIIKCSDTFTDFEEVLLSDEQVIDVLYDGDQFWLLTDQYEICLGDKADSLDLYYSRSFYYTTISKLFLRSAASPFRPPSSAATPVTPPDPVVPSYCGEIEGYYLSGDTWNSLVGSLPGLPGSVQVAFAIWDIEAGEYVTGDRFGSYSMSPNYSPDQSFTISGGGIGLVNGLSARIFTVTATAPVSTCVQFNSRMFRTVDGILTSCSCYPKGFCL